MLDAVAFISSIPRFGSFFFICRLFCTLSLIFWVLQVKVFGSRVRVDSVAKVAELELAEKQKMKDKVSLILRFQCYGYSYRDHVFLKYQP